MSKLFWANLTRLWKSKLLGIGIFIFAGIAALIVYDHYRYFKEFMVLDAVFFGYAYVAGIPVSVLAGFYLGVEHGDGTIRNKLIAGYKRSTVYLANLLAVFVSALMMSLAYVIVICLSGISVFGGLKSDWQMILAVLLESILILLALSAIFTMVGMLWQNKAVSVAICIFLAFGLNMLTISVASSLAEQEFYASGGYAYVESEDGKPKMVSLDGQPNPNYLQGPKRTVYEFIHDFNPVSQGLQMANMFEEHPKHMALLPLYSLVLILGVTGEGIYLFGKKDVK